MKQYYQYAASTWLFFSALTAFGGDIQCPNQVDIDIGNAKKFKARLENSVFQVVIESDSQPQKEETIGTATLVSSEGHLLTAAHIFEADNNRILRGIDNNQLKLFLRIPVDENEYVKYRSSNVIKLSDKHDLSVITLSDWDNNERFFPIWLDVKNDPYNDDARLMGYIINKRYPSVSGKGNIN